MQRLLKRGVHISEVWSSTVHVYKQLSDAGMAFTTSAHTLVQLQLNELHAVFLSRLLFGHTLLKSL